MDIPIIIICYNNYKYVENTLNQVLKINEAYYKNIQIVNNASSCINTTNFLKNTNVKVINNDNNGPWISDTINSHIYNTLPDKFVLTDPDLELNENTPHNFIEILSELSDKYKCSKIGLALDISEPEKMHEFNYCGGSIHEWEKKFWENKINDTNYELYDAGVDTTFCLINKKYIYINNNINFFQLRIAGNFTAKHLPWYKTNKIYNVYENYFANISESTIKISTIGKGIIDYIESKYLKIKKNSEIFFIENNPNNLNLSFWKDSYGDWEISMFEIFDKYLDSNKIFIDIGGWIGGTTMYGCRKAKHVYSFEADKNSFDEICINLKTNCSNNYTLANKIIGNCNLQSQPYENKLLTINDSINECEIITLKNIIKNYQINPKEVGIIKVDITGREESILFDLNDINKEYNVPFYVKFYYDLWCDKNLDRFNFLTCEQKSEIINNQIILFD